MSSCYDQDDRDLSLMAFDQYMRALRRLPRLSEGEEAWLVVCVERGKEERLKPCPNAQILEEAKQARDRLVEVFQPLVIYIARRWQRRFRSMELLDLIQEGSLGVMEAIERHIGGKGYSLTALTARCIRAALWHAWCDRDGMVRMPQNMRRLFTQVYQVSQQLQFSLKREPSIAEIAQEMGVTEKRLCDLLEWKHREHPESLQGLLQTEDAEEVFDFVSLFETSIQEDMQGYKELEGAVHDALETALSPRQRQVIRLRYGFDGNLGQRQVAKELGVRVFSVHTVEAAAKKRLYRVLISFYEKQKGEVFNVISA